MRRVSRKKGQRKMMFYIYKSPRACFVLHLRCPYTFLEGIQLEVKITLLGFLNFQRPNGNRREIIFESRSACHKNLIY